MLFTSLIFTFIFLPSAVVLYYLSKEKYRNYILLVFSLFFYAYGEPKFVLIMIFSIFANYVLAILINNRLNANSTKTACLFLILDILGNIGILFIFKYLGFTGDLINKVLKTSFSFPKLPLPIGISFFTFQALSYVIDVYRQRVKVQKNLLNLALYISFFPQLVAGPIVRYETIEEQIYHRECSVDKFGEGARRFFLGFAKKIILANNLAIVAEKAFQINDVASANPVFLWLGSICFSLQIFYDFSGYSDMAIGLGKIFGFEFEENFNYPYITKTVTEFWHRWHISLGKWFKDYVYIPLGGSRVKLPRHIFNLFIVWALTGIWHGAGIRFVAWGFWYFILLCLEKFIIKPEKRNRVLQIIWRIVSLLCINFGWIMFNARHFRYGIKYCLSMLGFYGTKWCIDADVIHYFKEYWAFIIFGIIFCTPICKTVSEKLNSKVKALVLPVVYSVLFLWAVSFILLGAHNPFIYFNF